MIIYGIYALVLISPFLTIIILFSIVICDKILQIIKKLKKSDIFKLKNKKGDDTNFKTNFK